MEKSTKFSAKFLYVCLIMLLTLISGVNSVFAGLPEEGMYPLYEFNKLDLKKAGLKIGISDIYNTKEPSLINAVVKFGGCTGSFVSKDGLIITNHHCVFGLVQKVSSVENNYVENGFLAKNRSAELPVTGQNCQITESYEDVSSQIISAVSDITDLTERGKVIQKKIKEIISSEEAKNPSLKIDISEMFPGKVFILYRSKIIKDMRLVYVPPRTIGEFGGETDNWVWPKHTGDFSFVRAYVAPDGSGKDYAADNVPYVPKRFLKVNPDGIEEGDFLFILGYPGRTFRNQTSKFVEFHEKVQLPYYAELYKYLISSYEALGKDKPDVALALSAKIKSLANAQKNYEGKLKGLNRLELVELKKAEENELISYINSNPAVKEKFGNLYTEINKTYEEVFTNGKRPLVMNQFTANVNTLKLADILLDYTVEMSKPESERKTNYKPANVHVIFEQIQNLFKEYNKDADKIALRKILGDAIGFQELKDLEMFKQFNNSRTDAEKFADELVNTSVFDDFKSYTALLEKPEAEIKETKNKAIEFARLIKSSSSLIEKEVKQRDVKLNDYLGQLYDVKKMWKQTTFLPDANSTLRFTYGFVRGYSPADATLYTPMTTLKGIIEKSYLGGEFRIPAKLKELYDKKDLGKHKNKKLDDLPVAILYNTDTSGGNSGSPIMNALGELIGVNFDRTYEATINDYAWNENYSRSIGVDIRYVLWVTQKIGGADYILQEMGVE